MSCAYIYTARDARRLPHATHPVRPRVPSPRLARAPYAAAGSGGGGGGRGAVQKLPARGEYAHLAADLVSGARCGGFVCLQWLGDGADHSPARFRARRRRKVLRVRLPLPSCAALTAEACFLSPACRPSHAAAAAASIGSRAGANTRTSMGLKVETIIHPYPPPIDREWVRVHTHFVVRRYLLQLRPAVRVREAVWAAQHARGGAGQRAAAAGLRAAPRGQVLRQYKRILEYSFVLKPPPAPASCSLARRRRMPRHAWPLTTNKESWAATRVSAPRRSHTPLCWRTGRQT